VSGENGILRTALALAERGLAVFPCKPRGKRPATANGLKDATTDAAVIEQWWKGEPAFNVAVVTGKISGIFVVDVDDGEAALKALEADHGELPPTVESITARGRHVWFQYPDRPVKNSVGKIAQGCDVRGDGGYILTPPSIHPSGRPYCWSTETANSLATAPDWLLDKIADPVNGARPAALPPSHWRELVLDGLDEGARNTNLTRLAGHFLRRRLDAILVLEVIRSLNATHCHPPLPDDDIVRIVESIAARDLKRRATL
jgi:Bifunctional DNA primase/polymerase, N-terminal/Primase C terminal 1 (PriCT-1)